MRRKPRVVLWGGRPGIDRQFGSDYDLAVAKFGRELAALRRAVGKQIAPVVAAAAAVLAAAVKAYEAATP